MKKLTAVLALGTLLAGTHALAGTVKFSEYPSEHSAGGGGPFKFEVVDSNGLGGVPGSFLTFCLEMNEHISPGSVYNAVINTGAKSGGVGGATDGFDALSSETAWLYNQFVLKEIVFQTASDATDFQNAIWLYEDEKSGISNKYTLMVENARNSDGTWDWAGIGNVRVLNLTKDGKPAQDVLTTVPIPGAVWLFGSALLGLIGLARRSA